MNDDIILLGHGSGGRLSHQLLGELIIPILSGVETRDQNDAAVLPFSGRRLAFTTDSYVVDPIFFPGGDIGKLAVCGTINDLAMSGAMPLALSVGFILEEGLPVADLRRILESMRDAAKEAGVRIVTGDTKVVPRGKGDKIFINCSGIGEFHHEHAPGGSLARPGDQILLSGTLGDHGLAILGSREGLELHSDIRTDSAALHRVVAALLEAGGEAVHVLRDPTRGGAATTLKEIALQSKVAIRLQEAALPVRPGVAGACAILGLDPLFVANEGKLLAFVAPEAAPELLRVLRSFEEGREAAVIGEVTAADETGRVTVETAIGGRRSLEMLSGEQLPRIC